MFDRLLHSTGGSNCSFRETDVAHTARALADGSAPIIDVREPHEWVAGHIDAAVLIPLGDLPRRLGELDPALPVIAVCEVGIRSLTAADILHVAGFTEAKSMAGGMGAWTAGNHPVVT